MKFVACLVLMGVGAVAVAEPVQVEATPRKVALFKNGLGLVVSEAALPQGESFVLSPLPRASFGMFWLGWPRDLAVERARTREAWVLDDVPADEVEQVFRNAFGADAVFDAAAIPVRRRVKQPALAFDADVPAKGSALQLTYLAQGIAWSPSYTVHLSEQEGKAALSAKAVVVNDLIDLAGADLELIAGYPNLQFADLPSAMSPDPLQQILEQLRNTGRRDDSDMIGNAMMRQSVSYERGPAGSSLPSMPATPVAGEGSEDLYFYQLPGVTLDKGERGYFPLFSGEIPAEHVHTWDIPDFLDDNDYYRGDHDPQTPRVEVVWHALKLTNTTDAPWTTGPAATFKDDRLLGQDTLHYCPPGGETRLRITQAVALDAEQNEFEIDRLRDAERFNGSSYDLVTIRGELKLTNYKDQPVEVAVTKTFSGELHEAGGTFEQSKLAGGLRRVNPRTKLAWCVIVQPGKNQPTTVTYIYKVHTRR